MSSELNKIRAKLATVPSGYAWLHEDVAYLLSEVERLTRERDDAVGALRERESALARIDTLRAQTDEIREALAALRDEYTLSLERRVDAVRERERSAAVQRGA